MFLFVRFANIFLILLLVVAGSVWAIEKPGEELGEVGIAPVLGTDLNLDLIFTDSSGRTGSLREFLDPKLPTAIVPVYYGCPRLCGLLLQGVTELVTKVNLTLGTEYRLLTISFDSTDTVAMAEKRRITHHAKAGVKNPADWPFLIGSSASVEALMGQIGFKAKSDGKDFAHTAALVLLTPTGQISQYFTGVSFPAWDVRLALIEASLGGIGSALDHVMLFCFRFDPTKGKYTWAVQGLLRLGGLLTIIFIGGLLWRLRSRERRSS